DEVAELLEESVAVVPGEEGFAVGLLHALGRQDRAGVVLAAVDAVGIGGDGPDAAGFDPEREQEFGAATAAASLTLDGDGAFATGDERGRPLGAPRALRHLFSHFARFTGDRVAEDLGPVAGPAENLGRGLERLVGSGDHLVLRFHRL